MKYLKLLFVFLLGSAMANMASAHGHASIGVYFGAPIFSPWYYPAPSYYGPSYYYGPTYYPYYSPPAVVTAPAAQPPVYIEKGDAASPDSKSSDSWYYCNNPDGYFPYVKDCPGGWKRVAPSP